MVAKTPLSVVRLHIVKDSVKLPFHYGNCYLCFIATNIATVNKGQLNVGSKYYLLYGTAWVLFPRSLWSLFPLDQKLCKQTQELLSAGQMNFVLSSWGIDSVSVVHKLDDRPAWVRLVFELTKLIYLCRSAMINLKKGRTVWFGSNA
jgi:hypothetical protein